MKENELGGLIVGAAILVHQELGPGLLESVYEVALSHELECRGLHVERQLPIGIVYRGIQFEEGFRLDLCVEAKVIIEVKCVEQLSNAHKKQLLTYLRLSQKKLGYLLNFSESRMKDGITRIVNGLQE